MVTYAVTVSKHVARTASDDSCGDQQDASARVPRETLLPFIFDPKVAGSGTQISMGTSVDDHVVSGYVQM